MLLKCEHCRRQVAFGKFKLVIARSGKDITKQLCADCGFNIVNFRVMSQTEFKRQFTPPSGQTFTRYEEAIFQKKIYTSCVLIEPNYDTLPIMKKAHMMERAEYLALVEKLRAEKLAAQAERREESGYVSKGPMVMLPLGGGSARRGRALASDSNSGSMSISSATQQETSSLPTVAAPSAVVAIGSPSPVSVVRRGRR